MLSPQFEYGAKVRVNRNIRNDGSVTNLAKGALLMRRGSVGYIRHSGVYKQDQIIYQVHFVDDDLMFGCRETELLDGELDWIENKFEYGDAVKLSMSLGHQGEILAKKDSPAMILSVNRNLEKITYQVQVAESEYELPERALAFVENHEVLL